jgi:hypothetical protein
MFVDYEKINWEKFIVVLGGLSIFWTSISAITPDSWDKYVFPILGGLVAVCTYFLKAEHKDNV